MPRQVLSPVRAARARQRALVARLELLQQLGADGQAVAAGQLPDLPQVAEAAPITTVAKPMPL